MKDNEPIIGIDLGTTFSCAAIMRNENVEIIEEKATGYKLIPSIVCFKSNNDCLIGTNARNNMLQYSQTTIFDSKRLIGHKFNNSDVQEDIKNWPFKVIEDKKKGKPQYVAKVGKEERKFFPEDVSSMILAYIKNYAEIFNTNNEIKKAVITVPANFNSLQREATIKAAEDAGLEVVKLINEPTAAAIAYGHIWKSDKERNVLIFDLGGGTFYVSIVKIKDKEYNVLASIGEEHLGGEDFTQILFNYVMGKIKKDNRFKDINFEDNNNDRIKKILNKLIKK